MVHLSALSLALNRPGAVSLEQVVASLFANNEQGAWYDPSDYSTMFQVSTGATPVTAVEQPVGLILDRRKGLVLGSELVTNGTFTTDTTSWTMLGTGTFVSTGGQGVLTVSSGSFYAGQAVTVVSGKWYEVRATFITKTAASTAFFRLGTSGIGGNEYVGVTPTVDGTEYVYKILTTSTTLYVSVGVNASGYSSTWDNISVKLLDGNHAYQTSSTARPVLRARYNLLTYSEEFDRTTTGGWTRTNIASVTANAVSAPDSTTTAEKVVWANATTDGRLTQITTMVTGATYTMSAYVKAAEFSKVLLTAGTAQFNAAFNLATESVISSSNAISPTITPVAGASGWYRVSVTGVAQGTGSFIIGNGLTGDTGDGTSGIYIWGADLRVGTSAGDYQRIAASTDYATVSTITGQAFRPYLKFDNDDATGDYLTTATIDYSAGDTVFTCAGIRKTGTRGTIVELSANANLNNGAFRTAFGTSANADALAYTGWSRGTATTFANTATTYNVQALDIVTSEMDISTPQNSLRVNAIAAASDATSQGTGNYGSYAMTVGGRVSGDRMFGHMYGLIVRAASMSASQIAAVESYMASKMGVTL